MIQSINKRRAAWLFVISGLIVVMIVLGGWVRLTGSGLSITEWDLITGVVPPITEAGWEQAFAVYRDSPQYRQVNVGMSLEEYKFIYYMEYLHRLLGRVLGAVFALPVFYLLFTKRLAWREAWPYVWIGLGLAFQGWLGWYMVQSGLADRPAVSHFRLTAHLLSALVLLGLTFWVGLDNLLGPARGGNRRLRAIGVAALAVFTLQTAYGGLMAGLKAGHLSNTWPTMFGSWVPAGMFSALDGFMANLLSNSTTVHFIHRWLAWGVAGLVIWLWVAMRNHKFSRTLRTTGNGLLGLVAAQVVLGVSVVLFGVPAALASLHQATAIGIFLALLVFLHRLGEGRGGPA
ncbi:MAG TPA: COX15/CtaA family protein [Anaerolineales bacterium]|nr:COX15/CtaA family protein [Anaerolineales bacterium]